LTNLLIEKFKILVSTCILAPGLVDSNPNERTDALIIPVSELKINSMFSSGLIHTKCIFSLKSHIIIEIKPSILKLQNKKLFIKMDSAKLLNIPSTIKDPNYRYKMPKLVISTQGSGGNVKTKLENYKELAHALTVPLNYPLKFIGMELGTQTDIKNDLQLINGSHAADKLQTLLDKFIEKFKKENHKMLIFSI
jgi:translation initiation factor 2 beta subunit (eIF-2beta)/eIF-5